MTALTESEMLSCEGGRIEVCFEVDVKVGDKPGHLGLCLVWPF